MIAIKSVRDHSKCLQMCLETSRCKAVNFFKPLKNEVYTQKGIICIKKYFRNSVFVNY